MEVFVCLIWPGQLPVVNPAENIWSHIKAKMDGRQFESPDQQWEARGDECCTPEACIKCLAQIARFSEKNNNKQNKEQIKIYLH